MGMSSAEVIAMDVPLQGPGIAHRVKNTISNIAERELPTPELQAHSQATQTH